MPASEPELKTLMTASLAGDAAAHRVLLDRLSGRLRGYYKGRLARIGRSATEAEDLVQEALIVPFGVPNPRLQAKRRVDEVALCDDID